MKYPGYIMRQSLVDELNKRCHDMEKELGTTEDELVTAQITGRIFAFRELIEWATEHKAPSLTNERC